MTQKGLPKSRVGCAACKIKRVKCDESRPECNICIKRGRVCPGYQRELKWSTKYEVTPSSNFSGPPNLSELAAATSKSLIEGQEVHAKSLVEGSLSSPRTVYLGDESNSPRIVPLDLTLSEAFAVPISAGCTTEGTEDSLTLVTSCFSDDYSDENMWLAELVPDEFQVQQMSPGLDGDETVCTMSMPPLTMTPTTLDDIVLPEEEHSVESDSKALINAKTATLRKSLTDLPTFLIDNWFKNVCAVWSGYDSLTNMNRSLASSAVSYSESVFYSLQSMSAACLTDQLPHLKTTALETAKRAVQAIRLDLARVSQPYFHGPLPVDLLLSMFCLGTSGCWIDTRQLGFTFLREIKSLLTLYNKNTKSLAPADQQVLAFFNNSCLYFDMLSRVVAESEHEAGTPWSKAQYDGFSTSDLLHPWTGISTNVLELFADSIALCRQFRARMRQLSRPTATSLQAALHDIRMAQQLEQSLETLSIPDVQLIPDTGDSLTPRSHLIDVAEAYRLASLLQLRQTFPDLHEIQQPTTDSTSYTAELVRLALDMVVILERIPLQSGVHCIQPILYLTASTGLKFDVPVSPHEQSASQIDEIFSADLRGAHRDSRSETDGDLYPTTTLEISETSIEVGRARRFLLERLTALEKKLPPKPIVVAKELMQQVWSAYDREGPSSNNVHWIDVMKETGLQTVFG